MPACSILLEELRALRREDRNSFHCLHKLRGENHNLNQVQGGLLANILQPTGPRCQNCWPHSLKQRSYWGMGARGKAYVTKTKIIKNWYRVKVKRLGQHSRLVPYLKSNWNVCIHWAQTRNGHLSHRRPQHLHASRRQNLSGWRELTEHWPHLPGIPPSDNWERDLMKIEESLI